MKTFKLILSSVLFLLAVSCTQKETKENNAYTVHINLNDAKLLKEEVATMNGMLLNDSTSEHFPGEMNKVIWKRDSIFVLDLFKDQGLYLYNSDGLLVNSYAKRGNGPGEFISLDDVNVTPMHIYLLDSYSNSKRIVLDKNFSFLYTEDAEKGSQHLYSEPEEDGGVWYERGNDAYGGKKDKLVYIRKGERKAVLPIPEDIANITFASFESFAAITPDTILYLPPVEPRIYKCYNGQAEILCELDFGNYWPDFSDVNMNKFLTLMRDIANAGKVYSPNILSDGKDFSLSFFCKDYYYIALFNYDDLSSHKLYKVAQKDLEALGNFVAMADGWLIFGKPGNLMKIMLK